LSADSDQSPTKKKETKEDFKASKICKYRDKDSQTGKVVDVIQSQPKMLRITLGCYIDKWKDRQISKQTDETLPKLR
jgi:hypothetical protein